jgi:hypothetical protein
MMSTIVAAVGAAAVENRRRSCDDVKRNFLELKVMGNDTKNVHARDKDGRGELEQQKYGRTTPTFPSQTAL